MSGGTWKKGTSRKLAKALILAEEEPRLRESGMETLITSMDDAIHNELTGLTSARKKGLIHGEEVNRQKGCEEDGQEDCDDFRDQKSKEIYQNGSKEADEESCRGAHSGNA